MAFINAGGREIKIFYLKKKKKKKKKKKRESAYSVISKNLTGITDNETNKPSLQSLPASLWCQKPFLLMRYRGVLFWVLSYPPKILL